MRDLKARKYEHAVGCQVEANPRASLWEMESRRPYHLLAGHVRFNELGDVSPELRNAS